MSMSPVLSFPNSEQKTVNELLICCWGDRGFLGVEVDSQLELGLALGSWEVDPSVLERLEGW